MLLDVADLALLTVEKSKKRKKHDSQDTLDSEGEIGVTPSTAPAPNANNSARGSMNASNSNGWGGRRNNPGSKLGQKKAKTLEREEATRQKKQRVEDSIRQHDKDARNIWQRRVSDLASNLLPDNYFENMAKTLTWNHFPKSSNDSIEDYAGNQNDLLPIEELISGLDTENIDDNNDEEVAGDSEEDSEDEEEDVDSVDVEKEMDDANGEQTFFPDPNLDYDKLDGIFRYVVWSLYLLFVFKIIVQVST